MEASEHSPPARAGLHGRPRVPSWLVPRPRVVAALSVPAALTVVRAPAGGGKTTALAEWAGSPQGPATGVWAAVEPTRTSRVAFWSYLLGLVEDADLPARGSVLAQGVDALRESSDVAGLLHRGFAELQPCALVVDAAHLLDDDVAQDLVDVAAGHPHVHVVVAVRGRGPFDSAAAHLRTDVHVVDETVLALDLAETAVLLDVPAEAAREVHRTTAGLPLAVRMARLGADGTIDPDGATDAVVRSLTATTDPRSMEFLRRTAVADRLDVTLAAELTGSQDALEDLDRMERLGLGGWSGHGATATFRYTSVVRTGVRAELRDRDPATWAALRRVVAVWSDRHGRTMEAVQAAVDAEDLDLVQAVVTRGWRDVLAFHVRGLGRLVEPFGLRRLRRYPVLLFYSALAANADPHRRRQALLLMGLALTAARLRRRDALPVEDLVLRLVEVVALRVSGQTRGLAQAARGLARRLADLDLPDRHEHRELVPVAHSHTGLAFLYAGRLDEAVAQFRLGLDAAPHPTARLHNLSCLAGVLALTGDLVQASSLLSEAQAADWPDGWQTGYQGSMYQLAEALLALERFDVRAAQDHLDVLAPHEPTIEHWPLIAHAQAMTDLLAGRGAEALERFDATRRRHAERRSSDPFGAHLDVTRRTLLVASGRGAAALDGHGPEPRASVAQARAHLVTGSPDAALATLASVAGVARSTPRTRAEHAVLEAAALVALGREEAAVTALSVATAVLSVQGLRTPLALVRRRDRDALLALAERHGLADAVAVLTDHEVPDVVLEGPALPALTARESVVLRELTRTGSAATIAAELHVSTHTVKSQLRTLYRKLGVTNREGALAAARRHGLLDDDAVGVDEP